MRTRWARISPAGISLKKSIHVQADTVRRVRSRPGGMMAPLPPRPGRAQGKKALVRGHWVEAKIPLAPDQCRSVIKAGSVTLRRASDASCSNRPGSRPGKPGRLETRRTMGFPWPESVHSTPGRSAESAPARQVGAASEQNPGVRLFGESDLPAERLGPGKPGRHTRPSTPRPTGQRGLEQNPAPEIRRCGPATSALATSALNWQLQDARTHLPWFSRSIP